ncbi:MAG: hypothetical protein Q4F95_02385 [Oscillospiraceae bacterium]|nr:hypothetical protein [Oscillospiraceae bacterium]
MKKKTILSIMLGLVGSVCIASSSMTVGAKDVRLTNMSQHPQEKNYWCGYSAMQSVIQRESYIGNLRSNAYYNLSQTGVANYMRDSMYVGDPYNGTECPWYSGNQSVDTNQNNYKASKALSNMSNFHWVAYGCGTTGSGDLSYSEVKWRLVSTLNAGHGCLISGRSNPNGSSYLPGYPSYFVCHWVATDGYTNDGNYIWIIDPAAHGTGVSFRDSVSAYYKVTLEKITDFAWYHGIMW